MRKKSTALKIIITTAMFAAVLLFATAVCAENIGSVELNLSKSGVQQSDQFDIDSLEKLFKGDYTFSGKNPTIICEDSHIYGTSSKPLKADYGKTGIKSTNGDFDILLKTQSDIELEKYTLLNRAPTIKIPVPIYADNIKETVFSVDTSSSGKEYTDEYHCKVKYTYSRGNGKGKYEETEMLTQISWNVIVPIDVVYTVEVKNKNSGGSTPTLSGLNTSGAVGDAVLGKNKTYFRNGEINSIDEKSVTLGAADGSIIGSGALGAAFTFGATPNDGSSIKCVEVTVSDPVTGVEGETKKYNTVESALVENSTIAGKTLIEITYEEKGPSITKTSDTLNGAHVNSGDYITYTLVVTNSAGKSFSNVTVSDVLPSQVTPVSLSIDGTKQADNWTGSYTFDIGAGKSKTFEIKTLVTANFSTSSTSDNIIKNKASLKYTSDEKEIKRESEETVHYLKPNPSYTLKKELTSEPLAGKGFVYTLNQSINYTVTLENTGNVPLLISVTDVYDYPDYFEFEGSDNASVSLPADDPKTTENEGIKKITFSVKLKEGVKEGNYVNTVVGTSDFTYTDPENGNKNTIYGQKQGDTLYKTDKATTPVVTPFPAMSVMKRVNGFEYYRGTSGETVNFLVRIRNTGSMDLVDIAVTDSAGAGLRDSTFNDITSAVTGNGKTVSVTNGVISKLEIGDYVDLNYTAVIDSSVKDGDEVKNIVSVNGEVDPGDDSGGGDDDPGGGGEVVVHTDPNKKSKIPKTGDETNLDSYSTFMIIFAVLGGISIIALLIFLYTLKSREYFDGGNGDYTPNRNNYNNDGYNSGRSTNGSGSYAPKRDGGENNGYQPRRNADTNGGYQPRRSAEANGNYQPRRSNDVSGNYQPRRSNDVNGNYQPRRSNDVNGNYQPRRSADANGGYQPRNNSGMNGSSQSGYNNHNVNSAGHFSERTNGNTSKQSDRYGNGEQRKRRPGHNEF